MSFRARIAVAAAAAVALAVVLASILTFFLVRAELRNQIDDTLRDRAAKISLTPLTEVPSQSGESFLDLRPGFGEPNTLVQLVKSDGTALRQRFVDVELPVSERAVALARDGAPGDVVFSDTQIGGVHVRVLTFAYGPGFAVQIARPLTEVDDALARLRLFLVVVALAGIAFAAVLGGIVSRAALRPVTRLTETTETVTETGDLSQRIEVEGSDELSRLATSFNTMLAALEESTRAQRQLVADASHELRTPLTSLRTNIEVLASDRALPVEERSRLMSDVVEQLGEMTTLIAELIELGRAEERSAEPEDVRLDLVAADALERVQRNRPGVVFSTEFDESVVRGVTANLERAIGNLLDNAAKWSPPGTDVEVRIADGQVVVRDHGPGIAEEDLPYVFDRFYRARGARGMSGSGLGLAIVRKVAEAHGGEVVAERAEGGGTRMTLRLPRTPARVAMPS
ncbi:MAG TPA: HAMP domain-containing sensor histidine kinase [Gaiellaceae bacterium]|nr:HAMP domain-containing sensor histidine kinase [Gaiellaceae bacterium]